MKNRLKAFLRWALTFVFCFVIIYLIIFIGGWKLFESGEPILMELGVALILSIFVFAANEIVTTLEKRIDSLEARIDELEKKHPEE